MTTTTSLQTPGRFPFVSVIIPCRNEENFMAGCLDSVIAQDYPKDRLEIIVADGMSTDNTRAVLDDYARRYAFIRWIENPGRIVPTGINRMIRASGGEIIVRLDAHALYPANYISLCVYHLQKSNADNVGGVLVTEPGADTPVARAIAKAIACRFGVGNADFRIGTDAPAFVDTVPFGCYQRGVFDRYGFYDETLERNEDDEFNSRLIKNGGKILLVPQIVSRYYARPTWDKLWRMYYQYGFFKPVTAVKLGGVMTWRQLVPAFFILSLAVSAIAAFLVPVMGIVFAVEAGLYVTANTAVSLRMALRENVGLAPYLMVSFLVVHFGYGIGYLNGLIYLGTVSKKGSREPKNLSLSR